MCAADLRACLRRILLRPIPPPSGQSTWLHGTANVVVRVDRILADQRVPIGGLMKLRLLAVAIATICFSTLIQAQGAPDAKPGPTTPVQVTNGSSNPVPVYGAVEILNDTLSVQQAGTRFQAGAQYPPTMADDCTLNVGQNNTTCTLLAVPPTSNLVIEQVSGNATNFATTPGIMHVGLITVVGGITTQHILSPTGVVGNRYFYSQPVRLYADAGTQVRISFVRFNSSTEDVAFLDFAISGRLLP
jgi:hypothetical protein